MTNSSGCNLEEKQSIPQTRLRFQKIIIGNQTGSGEEEVEWEDEGEEDFGKGKREEVPRWMQSGEEKWRKRRGAMTGAMSGWGDPSWGGWTN